MVTDHGRAFEVKQGVTDAENLIPATDDRGLGY